MRPASALIALLLAALVIGAATASGATTQHCREPAQGQGPRNDRSLPIGNVTARGMSCSAARTAIRKGMFTLRGGCFAGPHQPPCLSSFTTPGFRCTAPRLGLIRCVANARRFRFGWSE